MKNIIPSIISIFVVVVVSDITFAGGGGENPASNTVSCLQIRKNADRRRCSVHLNVYNKQCAKVALPGTFYGKNNRIEMRPVIWHTLCNNFYQRLTPYQQCKALQEVGYHKKCVKPPEIKQHSQQQPQQLKCPNSQCSCECSCKCPSGKMFKKAQERIRKLEYALQRLLNARMNVRLEQQKKQNAEAYAKSLLKKY